MDGEYDSFDEDTMKICCFSNPTTNSYDDIAHAKRGTTVHQGRFRLKTSWSLIFRRKITKQTNHDER